MKERIGHFLHHTFSILHAQQKGVTLIELVIVMFLLALFGGIVAADLRSGNRNLALARSAQNVTQALERAKALSLGGKTHKGTVSGGGYGVHFDRQHNEIFLFADCDGDLEYDIISTASSCADASPGNPYLEKVMELFLEDGIELQHLSFSGSGGCITSPPPPQTFNVVFIPPDPQTEFLFNPPKTLDPACTEAFIRLENLDEDQLTVYINRLGVTRIQD